MTEQVEAVTLEFMEAWETDAPLTLEDLVRRNPGLSDAERVDLVDFVLEYVATENYLKRNPIPDEELSEIGGKTLARVLEMLRAGEI